MDFISIDWDFFTLNRELDGRVENDAGTDKIPGALLYDWQMSETRHPEFESAIWEIRAASLKRFGCDPINATRIMTPVADFARDISCRWLDFCMADTIVADSHGWMLPVARKYADDNGEPLTVYNFDAHHDLGYQSLTELDCGNWAYLGLKEGTIKNFIQVYPDFRERKEWTPRQQKKLKAFPGRIEIFTWSEFLQAVEPSEEREVEGTFLCRSSSWTPPWHDQEFQALLEEFVWPLCIEEMKPEYKRYDPRKPREWVWRNVDDHLERIETLLEQVAKGNS